MDGMVDRLEDHFDRQAEQAADPGHGRRRQMGDVVLLVLVERDGLHQRDLHLIGDQDRGEQVGAAAPAMLGHGYQSRDVVSGMGVVGGEKRIVEVEFPHGGGICPPGPFGRDGDRRGQAEQCRAPRPQMAERLVARIGDRPPLDGYQRHGGIVDDPACHHARGVRVDGPFGGCKLGECPGKLALRAATARWKDGRGRDGRSLRGLRDGRAGDGGIQRLVIMVSDRLIEFGARLHSFEQAARLPRFGEARIEFLGRLRRHPQ